METVILLAIAASTLCCMATNTVMTFKLLYQKRETPAKEPEKTAEEKERERNALEAHLAEMEGLQNIMAYTGFNWKNRGDA